MKKFVLLSNCKKRKPKYYHKPVVYVFRSFQKRKDYKKTPRLTIRIYKEAIEFLKVKKGDLLNVFLAEDSILLKKTSVKDDYSYTLSQEGKYYLKISVGKLFYEQTMLPNGKYVLAKEKNYFVLTKDSLL